MQRCAWYLVLRIALRPPSDKLNVLVYSRKFIVAVRRSRVLLAERCHYYHPVRCTPSHACPREILSNRIGLAWHSLHQLAVGCTTAHSAQIDCAIIMDRGPRFKFFDVASPSGLVSSPFIEGPLRIQLHSCFSLAGMNLDGLALIHAALEETLVQNTFTCLACINGDPFRSRAPTRRYEPLLTLPNLEQTFRASSAQQGAAFLNN